MVDAFLQKSAAVIFGKQCDHMFLFEVIVTARPAFLLPLQSPAAAGLSLWIDIGARVHSAAVYTGLKMEMGTGDIAGGAYIADDIAPADRLSRADENLRKVAVAREQPGGAGDVHAVAVAHHPVGAAVPGLGKGDGLSLIHI